MSLKIKVVGYCMELGAFVAFVGINCTAGALGGIAFWKLFKNFSTLPPSDPNAWLGVLTMAAFTVCFFFSAYVVGGTRLGDAKYYIDCWVGSHTPAVKPPEQPAPIKSQGPLTEERMGQIAILYLKEVLRKRGGIELTPNMRREVGNIAKAIDIPVDEAMLFTESLVREAVDEIFNKKQ